MHSKTGKQLLFLVIGFCLLNLIGISRSFAQFRQVHIEAEEEHALKLSFYSNLEGYVAFSHSIGATVDSGRTFIYKKITTNNVDYNKYSVNVTFGFEISGVYAFNKNNLLVYGNYGLVPAILSSKDGGSTFKIVFHDQYSTVPNSFVSDIVFPQAGLIGYATDKDRILKTTDGGQTWTISIISRDNGFTAIEAIDNSPLIAWGSGGHIFKTDDGNNWQELVAQGSFLRSAFFVTTARGWTSDYDGNVYLTQNGGSTWAKQNNADGAGISCYKMKFINDSTGYALNQGFDVYKTSNSGKIWERLNRNNNYSYLGYSLNDFQFKGNQIWTAGGHGQIQLSTNAGGQPVPKALFNIDTIGVAKTDSVKLLNFTRSGYTYTWLANGKNIGSSYNIQYLHSALSLRDTLRLIARNAAGYKDTLTRYQDFPQPVIISGFTPQSGIAGTRVTITGFGFDAVSKISFGGVTAASFTVVSPTSIIAIVGNGASGNVSVVAATGGGIKAGFTFVPAPVISSFSPPTAKAGSIVTINGTDFTGATAVTFGGMSAISFNVLSPTKITAVLGNGSAGAIMVTTPGGTGSIPGFNMIPVISQFSPATGTIGTELNITGTGFTNASVISIGGIPASSFTVNSATSITAIVGVHSNGEVMVTTPGGTGVTTGKFTYVVAPTISYFSPMTGPVGTDVKITGTGFDPTPSNNTVLIGAVKVPVISATATTLNIKVPFGVTYSPIIVQTNHLQAYTAHPFTLTFVNGGGLNSESFHVDSSLTIGHPGYGPVVIGDVDGDGKTDIISYNNTTYSLDLSINSTAGGYKVIDLSMLLGRIGNYAMADLNGDGLPELIVGSSNNLLIYKNISSPGKPSFSAPFNAGRYDNINYLAVNDMDGDGKPDIVLAPNGAKIVIYLNKSEPDSISFNKPQFPELGSLYKILVNDFNNDGKPDITTEPPYLNERLVIARNYSRPGELDLPVDGYGAFELGSARGSSALTDVDSDGKMDIVVSYPETHVISVYHNISAGGDLIFENKVNLSIDGPAIDITSDDLDGDGKPDLVLNYHERKLVSVIKNLTAASGIAYAAPVNIATDEVATNLAIADVNSDGRSDIVYAPGNKRPRVLINEITPVPFINSFIPGSGAGGSVIRISGMNLTGTTAVKFGGVNAASFSIVADTLITAIVGSYGASGEVSVTNSYGSSVVGGFTFGAPPVILSVTPTTGAAGTTVIIKGDNFDSEPANNIVYFGGVKAIVTTASKTSITVNAPAQATYQHITVAANGLIAYYATPFALTYENGYTKFDKDSFKSRQVMTGDEGGVADMDGDGKPDLVYFSGYGNQSLLVSRNKSALNSDSAEFAPAEIIGVGSNIISRLEIADINGDGKLDVIYNIAGRDVTITSLYFVINHSTPGNISFSAPLKLAEITDKTDAYTFISFAIQDMDGDGLPDLVGGSYEKGLIYVYRNTTVNGNLRFDQRNDYNVDRRYISELKVHDMDNDGKPDLLVNSTVSFNMLSVFPNNSVKGSITFKPRIDLINENTSFTMDVADVDGDQKADIVTVSNILQGYHNTTLPNGTISIAATYSGYAPSTSAIHFADLNGDGKPELLLNSFDGQLTLVKNISFTGTISFADSESYTMPESGFVIGVADMNMDGKADLIYATNNKLKILLNKNKVSLSLPPKNLRAEFISVTCRGENNGQINVNATVSEPYIATITGPGTAVTVRAFTKTLSLTGLPPGDYSVCVSVDKYLDFQQCFSSSITEPKELSVYTVVNEGSKNLDIKLDGGEVYNITLNGTTYRVNGNSATLRLNNGNNELQVTTDRTCQGVINKIITVGNQITAYPNPFTDRVQIDIGQSSARAADIQVVNLFGKTILTDNVKVINGKITLALNSFSSGVYMVRLKINGERSIYKIWKK